MRLCEFPGLNVPCRVRGGAPGGVWGTGAERALWAKQRGGTSGNGKERLRDYSVSRFEIPQRSRIAKRSKKKQSGSEALPDGR